MPERLLSHSPEMLKLRRKSVNCDKIAISDDPAIAFRICVSVVGRMYAVATAIVLAACIPYISRCHGFVCFFGRVLIHAAAGGVGLAAIQLLQELRSIVIATAGSPSKRSMIRSVPKTLECVELGSGNTRSIYVRTITHHF